MCIQQFPKTRMSGSARMWVAVHNCVPEIWHCFGFWVFWCPCSDSSHVTAPWKLSFYYYYYYYLIRGFGTVAIRSIRMKKRRKSIPIIFLFLPFSSLPLYHIPRLALFSRFFIPLFPFLPFSVLLAFLSAPQSQPGSVGRVVSCFSGASTEAEFACIFTTKSCISRRQLTRRMTRQPCPRAPT